MKPLRAILVFLPLVSGCQTARFEFGPSEGFDKVTSQRSASQSDFILAASFNSAQPEGQSPGTAQDEAPKKEDKDADKKNADAKDGDADSARKPPPYSVPGAQFQQAALLAVGVSAFGTSDIYGTGKEAAESQATSTSIVGRPGLSAPPPRVSRAIVGRPGLQQGFAIGLGPASDRNIFTANRNPLSGATGRCQELVNTGFFSSRGACEANFRR